MLAAGLAPRVPRGVQNMHPFIPDESADSRMTGLELFLERYLGPRRSEYGESETEIASIEMPDPLRRFFKFAGRWPGQNPRFPFVNRFCIQDMLCSIRKRGYAPALQLMDNRLIFVCENQSVWVAATERSGLDPPVWISEESSHRDAKRIWREIENPLSHFLVSFVLQEAMFSSKLVACAHEALEKLQQVGLSVEPVWARGEYAWEINRPTYYLVADRFLLRRELMEADGDDWYGCEDSAGAKILGASGLPTTMG